MRYPAYLGPVCECIGIFSHSAHRVGGTGHPALVVILQDVSEAFLIQLDVIKDSVVLLQIVQQYYVYPYIITGSCRVSAKVLPFKALGIEVGLYFLVGAVRLYEPYCHSEVSFGSGYVLILKAQGMGLAPYSVYISIPC